ncbi:hypothetical protein T492DRAFT_1139605 [Pavlovales sp. CCMP2436]|nr:hypothetical protein T492DRAFT_1139605 [Pavlovales sp. CCMP2436]
MIIMTTCMSHSMWLVVLTATGPASSNARRLFEAASANNGAGGMANSGKGGITVRLSRLVERALVGDALEAWQERRAAQRRADQARLASEIAAMPVAETSPAEPERRGLQSLRGEAEEGAPASAVTFVLAQAQSLAVAEEGAPASAVDSVLAQAQSLAVGAHPLMPFSLKVPRVDEWGEQARAPLFGPWHLLLPQILPPALFFVFSRFFRFIKNVF